MLKNQSINFKHSKLNFTIDPNNANPCLLKLFLRFPSEVDVPGLYWGPAGGGGGVPMPPVWIFKRLVLVFINDCRLLSALPSLLQFGWGRLSLVAISFYVLLLLFGPCRLSEFTLAGPLYCMGFELNTIKVKKFQCHRSCPGRKWFSFNWCISLVIKGVPACKDSCVP